MLAGAVATALSLLLLAWTREIVQGVLTALGADPNSRGVQVSSIVFATVLVYILDVAINTGIMMKCLPSPFCFAEKKHQFRQAFVLL